MTLTDTGPIVALFNANDRDHAACRSVLPSLRAPLLTTWPCLTESMYLLGRELGYPAQKELWRFVLDGVLALHFPAQAEQERMAALMDKFRDTPMDLADASLVAAAESLALRRVFTLDKHFYAYRTEDGQSLEVIP